MAKGYVVVSQWHSLIRTWDELIDPGKHTGDAVGIDRIVGFTPPTIYADDPGMPSIGRVTMRIEDDGTLTPIHTNYDTSD